jgi:hypothetical protein
VELKNISANGAPAGENLGRRGGQSLIGDEGWVGLRRGRLLARAAPSAGWKAVVATRHCCSETGEAAKWARPGTHNTFFFYLFKDFLNPFKFKMVKDGLLLLEKFQTKYGCV